MGVKVDLVPHPTEPKAPPPRKGWDSPSHSEYGEEERGRPHRAPAECLTSTWRAGNNISLNLI